MSDIILSKDYVLTPYDFQRVIDSALTENFVDPVTLDGLTSARWVNVCCEVGAQLIPDSDILKVGGDSGIPRFSYGYGVFDFRKILALVKVCEAYTRRYNMILSSYAVAGWINVSPLKVNEWIRESMNGVPVFGGYQGENERERSIISEISTAKNEIATMIYHGRLEGIKAHLIDHNNVVGLITVANNEYGERADWTDKKYQGTRSVTAESLPKLNG